MALTTNSTAYATQALQPSHRRQMLDTAHSDPSGVLGGTSTAPGSRKIEAGTETRANAGEGTLVFNPGSGTSNSSFVEDVTNALILTGTNRWPSTYTVRQLHLTIVSLFVVVVAASMLQAVVLGLWRLFRLDPDDLPK
jgi:hypothetical protein